MTKRYVYENCVICVLNTNISYQNLHKATENFLKKVLKENVRWNPKSQLEN